MYRNYGVFTEMLGPQPGDHDPSNEEQLIADQALVRINFICSVDGDMRKFPWVPNFTKVGVNIQGT